MTSGAREALKWLAVVLMTGDHVAKVFFGGYVPVVSELGRIAFPIFALVMAYNLAQPGADVGKSVRRLLVWGIVAQPFHAVAFGYWLPLNVLLSFALAAFGVWCILSRRWVALVLAVVPAPLLVDYQWAGIVFVLAAWHWFRSRRDDLPQAGASINGLYFETLADWRDFPFVMVLPWCMLGAYNGNGWAFLALPVFLLGDLSWTVPRTRWAFYGYYVGHLALLSAIQLGGRMDVVLALAALAAFAASAKMGYEIWRVRRALRQHDAEVRRRSTGV